MGEGAKAGLAAFEYLPVNPAKDRSKDQLAA